MSQSAVTAILKSLDRPTTTEQELVERTLAYKALNDIVGKIPRTITNGDRYLQLCIPVDRLVIGHYYAGKCRNANIAKWGSFSVYSAASSLLETDGHQKCGI